MASGTDKKKNPPTREEELLKSFVRKMKIEAFMKSLIVGFVFGFLLCIPVSVIAFIAAYNTIWISVGCLIGGTVGFTFLSYFKYYRTNLKKTALRVDAVGLEERTITMIECADRDDAIANRQRADATAALEKIEPKSVKIPFPKVAVIAVAIAAAIAVVMMVTSTVYAVKAEEEAERQRQEELIEPELSEEDKIIAAMIAELRKEIDEAKVREELKDHLHGLVDDLEKRLRPEDSKDVKIAKISETAQKIHKLLQEELSRYRISDELKKHTTTKGLGNAVESADMNAIETETRALYGIIEPSIDSGTFDTLITTAGDLVQSLLDAGYEVDGELQAALVAAGYNLVGATVKARANMRFAAQSASVIPDNDALAAALEKLAQDLMAAIPPPEDEGFDKEQVKDEVDQAIQDAIDSIQGAVQDQTVDETLQDTIQDAMEQLGSEASQPDKKDPEEEDKENEDSSNNGPSHTDDDGNIVYDSVIDGKTEYMEYYDLYYEDVLQLLTTGDLTEEQRRIIENYFNILN